MVERRRRWWGGLTWRVTALVAFGLALAIPHPVRAKTFQCGAGDVQCLIDAINAANAHGEKNTIRLEAGIYTLTQPDNIDNGLPVITSPLTIVGAGVEATIIEQDTSAQRDFRLLAVAAAGNLALKGLTLRGGHTNVGAGIQSSGTLALVHTALVNNIGNPGGLLNDGTLTIVHSTIANNGPQFVSGGLLNTAKGTVFITATTFAHNTADGAGAIRNEGTLVVTASTFRENEAGGTGDGGAISNSGTLEVINTTFARNVLCSFRGDGAAISNSGTVILTNSTLADNTGGAFGGCSVSALFSTMSATTILHNTILARNTDALRDCRGPVISFGNNLIGDPTGCAITLQPTDLTGDPGLDTFTDAGTPGNGHYPLLPTSQAIDAGNDAVCPSKDQVGQRRIGRCDIGAIRFLDGIDRQHDDDPAAVTQATK
jgi:hypothetical protein